MADQLLSAIQTYRQNQKAVEKESLFNAIREYRMKGVEPTVVEDVSRIESLKQLPRAINLGEGGLPIGEEPMVSGPDILAMEPGQTKTFTEGEPIKVESQSGRGKISSFVAGEPVEVRRAEAISLTGKIIPEPISPDGMDYEQRAQLLREKEKEFNKTGPSPVVGMAGVGAAIDLPIAIEIFSLSQKQAEHDARYKAWLSQMIGGGQGVTPSGEKVDTPTRKQAAFRAVGDFRQQIDNIIVNDKFLEYASTKGLTTPGYWSKKLGRIGIGTDEYQSEIENLQSNPQARKLAEEWAMTTPEFAETVGDIFGRVWDGYAGAIGSGTVGSIGLALKGMGLENVGQELVDAADFADQMRGRGQDLREVGAFAQFGRDVAGGLGFTSAALVTGGLSNTLRATLGFNSARTINLWQKGTILGFSGLNSAWFGYNDARNNGATDEQAKQASLFSGLTQGPIELLSPLQKWIRRLDRSQQEKIYKGLNKAAIAVIEGTQEALFNEMPQQIAGNLVAKFVYEPNQDIFEGTVYAGGVGGVTGIIASIFTQMLGVKKKQKQTKTGNELGSEQADIESAADKASQDLAPDPESALAAQMMEKSTEIDNLKEEIASDEMGLQVFEEGTPDRQQAQMAINAKKDNLTQLEDQFAKLSAAPAQTSSNLMENRNKDLFPDTTDFAGKLSTDVRINSYTEKDGIGTAEYVNPENGSTDVYVSAFGDNDFIAYIRIYDEKGNPTNRFASKLERRTERAGASKAMIEELQSRLPENHEYTEDVSASTDGLRFISSQLQRGYDLVRDDKGNVETNRIAINGESIVNDLGADVIREGQEFADIQVTNKNTFDRVKQAIAPILEKFNAGLGANNIYWENGRVYVDIPVLRKTESKPSKKTSKEQINTRIEELNKEFDVLDENDTAGQDRVNKAIFAEQNKLAEMTAIEQGVDPQATTPTREMGLPPSGRRTPFGTFYPDRPVLQAFLKATDKAIARIKVAGKRAQKLKNAIRTNIARNAGFLAGINAEVISSEEYGKLTGGKQVAADSGTYRAAYFGGKKYLVLPDVNQLTGETIKGEQRAASRDAALDQESRAAEKKLEEEMIHLSMYQALQDEFAKLKKPKQTEQQYIVSRIGQIAKEVKRTNPNAVPGVSEAYLGPEMGTLDDVGFSMEFMRMVIQRVRTGQITEDLNAIRAAEREAFSDADKGAIASLKNSILNAIKFLRGSLARYLGKGTSTKEVKRLENSMNNLLDEYGIVKGEANYEFKDYSAAQPKGEVSLTITPTDETTLEEEAGEPTGGIEARAGKQRKALKEGVEVQLEGGNMERMMEILSASQYAKNIAGTIGKESFQNSVDAVMKLPAETPKVIVYGNRKIDNENELFRIADNGVGMTPEVMINVFLRAAVSGKGVGEGGGFGLAKLAFLGSPKSFQIISIGTDENGQKFKSTLKGTGKAFYRFNSVPPKVVFKPNTLINLTPNFADSLTLEYTQVPDNTKTGTASSYTLQEKSWEGEYAVRKGLEFVQGITSMGMQNYPDAEYDETMGGMAQITGELDFYPLWSGVNEGTQRAPEFTSLHSISTPYADIDIVAPKDAKISKIEYINVPVLNRSIYQFTTDIRLKEQVALPAGISINIKPKVSAESPNYPFTPNREAVKEDIKDKIGSYFNEAGSKELQKLNEKYRNALDAAVKIKDGDGGVILDAGSTVPQGTLEMLANNESVKRAYDDVKKIQDAILKILTKRSGRAFDSGINLYGRAKFAGLLIGARAFGVHFGKNANIAVDPNDPNFQSFIYHDIWKEMDLAYTEFDEYLAGPQKAIYENMDVVEQMSEIYDIFLRKVAGVAFHEAMHQQVDSEGETLARELTFKTGDIIDAVVALLESDLNTNERIQTINDILKQKKELDTTSNEEAGSEFVLSQGGYDGYALAERGRETEGRAEPAGDRGAGRQQAPEAPIVAMAAPYVQDIEVFDRNGENKRVRQIAVTANSPAEAAQLVRNTPEYQSLSQKSRERKLKFFTIGEPRLKRQPGESGIVAGAGGTPKVVSEQRKITNDMLDQLNKMIDTLQPKRSRAGKEYVSRTTLKGKTYPASLVSRYSRAANLYTSNTYEEAIKALDKLFTKNPDADFLSVVSDVANQTDRYGLTKSERNTITPILYRLIPAYREEIMDSKAAIKDRETIALKSLDLESNLAKLIVDQQQSSARTLNAAKQVRQIGGAGTAVAAYKSRVIDALADLYTIIRGDFTQVAEAVRGDRRKSVDNVFNLKEVLSKITQLKKKAEKNPQAAADSIRKAISGKKTRKAREIVLEFCASMFDANGDKYANMMVDETAKAIMSIGADRKEFSSDNVYRYIYQAFAAVAKQTAKEQAAVGAEPKAKETKKRDGKALAQVKAVIVNDKAYKEFIKQLKAKIGENYQDQAQFEEDYKGLFSMLGDRQWSEAMRNQAIKDSADFLDYKFEDLITYIGENRSEAQSAVKAHIRAELSTIGATNEQIDKFVDDVDAYLNEETAKRVKKSLGFEISKETGRIIGGTIEKEAMKKVATAEERFKLAKTLKGLTKLAASDQRAFLDKLNELIITELGFDAATSQELSKYIEEQMANAIQSQKSENLQQAIDRAEKVLENNKIKPKTNQRTILQRLIEMANMGQLDEFGVYEAFRQTHDFGKGYLEWNPNLANQLREWGDRIAALPEGLTRGIEEQKLGRFMLENQVFSARDYFSSYWYFALLSGTATQAINFTSGAFNLLGNIATWGIYTKGKSVGPMMRALYRAIIAKEASSRNAFSYVMQTGLNPAGISDLNSMKYPKINVFEGANPGNTPKWGYNLITFGDGKIDSAPAWLNATLATASPKSIMRLMRAVDAFIREAAYQARLEALGASPYQKNQYEKAKEQATLELAGSNSKGKEKGREIIFRANEIYSQQRSDQDKAGIANDAAEETIYRQEPEGLIGSLAGFANVILSKYASAQLFIPFTNTVANVLNTFLNYTPLIASIRLAGNIELAPLLKGKIKLTPQGMKADFIKGREDKAAEIAIKGMIGFVASFIPFIADAVQGGDDEERKLVEFYDAGPDDPEQNRIWRDNGGIPYSMRVGDKYVSYLFTPLVIPLASGAKMLKWAKANEKKEQKTPVDLIEKYATVMLAPLGVGFVASLEQSFLTGVSDLVDLKNSANIPRDTLRIATNIVARIASPGIMRDVQKLIVDERVEGDTVASNLLKEMPGSAEFLDKKLGYFGDPAQYNSILEENGFGRRALSLIGRLASSETPDPAFQIMYRNGLTPPKWQGSLRWSNEVRMTKPEQREFVSIAGPIMKEWIIDNEDIINDLTAEEGQDYVANNFSQIRRGVKADLEYEKGIGVD